MPDNRSPSTVWIDPKVLAWHRYLAGSSGGDPEEMRRPYEHWSHAARLLDQRGGPFDRVDAITTLKRAVDHRVKALKWQYDLGAVPLSSVPNGELQRLEHLGIARHAMVVRLIDIRNRVEHQDADPPDADTCRDFVELTWYFLRSTDLLLIRVPEHFDLEWYDDVTEGLGAAVSMATGPFHEWDVKLNAVLPPTFISMESVPKWLEVQTELNTSVVDFKLEAARPWRLAMEQHREAPREYRAVKGVVKGPEEVLLQIFRIYFEPMF